MQRSLRAALLGVPVLALFACGGSVVFVEDGGEGGSGGTSTGSKTTTTTKGQTTSGSTVQNTTVVTTDGVVVSTSTGPGREPVCQFGMITDACNQCAEQAQFQQCEAAATGCFDDDACLDYADCIFSCGNTEPCCDMCANANPDGAKLYTDLVFCLVCVSCPTECAGATPGLCN